MPVLSDLALRKFLVQSEVSLYLLCITLYVAVHTPAYAQWPKTTMRVQCELIDTRPQFLGHTDFLVIFFVTILTLLNVVCPICPLNLVPL